MSIPDYISPIVAYRVWQWDDAGLRSLNGEPWVPGKPLMAGCRASGSGILVGRADVVHGSHDAPQTDCTCGIYGSRNLDHLRSTQYWQYGGIHGEVSLWGSVVEHEAGFRSEFAYPKTLYLPAEMLPVTLKKIQARIHTLIGYGCDLFIGQKSSNIPLWRKGSGLDAAGLDFLTSGGQEWYARHQQERTLKTGDRIAVLGHGIALVEKVNDEDVWAVLWNRVVLRFRRTGILWDVQNMRWESARAVSSQFPIKVSTRESELPL